MYCVCACMCVRVCACVCACVQVTGRYALLRKSGQISGTNTTAKATYYNLAHAPVNTSLQPLLRRLRVFREQCGENDGVGPVEGRGGGGGGGGGGYHS